jgi:hypothetical protein
VLRATLLAVLAGACLQLGPVQARSADPIPPVAPWLSDAEALALLPAAVRSRSTKQLVLHRSSPHLHFEAEPLHLLDALKTPSAEQLKSMEQTPQWRQRLVEASR